MLDRLHDYGECLAEPERWAVATVSAVSGSAPRPIGTSMAVRDDAVTIGSISAGCVEGAVVDAAMTNLATGRSTVECYADDQDALSVGLMCGGDLQVLVQPMRELGAVARALAADDPDAPRFGLVRGLSGPEPGRPVLLDREQLTAAELDRQLGPSAGRLLDQLREGGVQSLELRDRAQPLAPASRLLFELPRPRPTMIIYGANDYAAALARAAVLLDRRVVVCDARPIFATDRRLPGAHEVVVERPVDHLRAQLAAGRLDNRSAVIVLTHDPRFDLPVIELALRSQIGYVGALGSRPTQANRAQELRNGGLPEALLERLHAPIGLNLGARTPAEVAVAILAEVVAHERGRSELDARASLRDTVGPVRSARRAARPANSADSADTGTTSATEEPSWT